MIVTPTLLTAAVLDCSHRPANPLQCVNQQYHCQCLTSNKNEQNVNQSNNSNFILTMKPSRINHNVTMKSNRNSFLSKLISNQNKPLLQFHRTAPCTTQVVTSIDSQTVINSAEITTPTIQLCQIQNVKCYKICSMQPVKNVFLKQDTVYSPIILYVKLYKMP